MPLRENFYDAKTTRHYVELADKHAHTLRQSVCIDATSPLDPFDYCKQFGIVLMDLDKINGLSENEKAEIEAIGVRTWSGGAKMLPNGNALVLLNAQQTQERARVTLMEEIVHKHLKHKPSTLTQLPGGLYERSYNPESEQEAYWTAAAVLLPSQVVGKSIWQRRSAEVVGKEYGVSIELVEFRIKTLNLWRQYVSYMQKGS